MNLLFSLHRYSHSLAFTSSASCVSCEPANGVPANLFLPPPAGDLQGWRMGVPSGRPFHATLAARARQAGAIIGEPAQSSLVHSEHEELAITLGPTAHCWSAYKRGVVGAVAKLIKAHGLGCVKRTVKFSTRCDASEVEPLEEVEVKVEVQRAKQSLTKQCRAKQNKI